MVIFEEEMQKVVEKHNDDNIKYYEYNGCRYYRENSLNLAIKCKINSPKDISLKDLILNEFNTNVKKIYATYNICDIDFGKSMGFGEIGPELEITNESLTKYNIRDKYKYYYNDDIWEFETLFETIVAKMIKLKGL